MATRQSMSEDDANNCDCRDKDKSIELLINGYRRNIEKQHKLSYNIPNEINSVLQQFYSMAERIGTKGCKFNPYMYVKQKNNQPRTFYCQHMSVGFPCQFSDISPEELRSEDMYGIKATGSANEWYHATISKPKNKLNPSQQQFTLLNNAFDQSRIQQMQYEFKVTEQIMSLKREMNLLTSAIVCDHCDYNSEEKNKSMQMMLKNKFHSLQEQFLWLNNAFDEFRKQQNQYESNATEQIMSVKQEISLLRSSNNVSIVCNSNSDENEIKQWLMNTVGLPQYINNFLLNGFDAMNIIKIMGEKQLGDIGIVAMGHRFKILHEINKLNQDSVSACLETGLWNNV